MATEEQKNLPLEQVRVRLQELGERFRERMIRLAIKERWVGGLDGAAKDAGEELFQEVSTRFWQGNRKWRADLNDEQNYASALRSVASNRRRAIGNAAEAITAGEEAFELATNTVAANKSSDPDHLHAVVEDSRLTFKSMVRAFAADPQVLRIIALRARGTDRERIPELSGLESAPYEAARKRIQRYVSSTRAAGEASLHEPQGPKSNLIASHYYLLQHQMVCPECRQPTPIYAFAVPESHVFLDGSDLRNPQLSYPDDPEGECNFPVEPVVLEVEDLPPAVAQKCQEFAPTFYRDAGDFWGRIGWFNHCASCGVALYDAIGHDDDCITPECPFKIDSRVHRFDEPIELRAFWTWKNPPCLST